MNLRKHRPIIAGLFIEEGDHYVTENGHWWNPQFQARVREYQNFFESRLVEKVDQVLSHPNWAINFVQLTPHEDKFLVDLYCDDPKDYAVLYNLVQTNIPSEFSFRYFPMGNIEKYRSKN